MSKATGNALDKKAKRKYKDQPGLWALHRLESESHKRYTRALYCAQEIRIDHDKTRTFYCKKKCCAICNSIRAQQRYNYYKDMLTGKMQFTTLTVPNCTVEQYEETIREIKRVWAQIQNTLYKRHGVRIKGVANCETTINTEEGTLHPHLHILHDAVEIERSGRALKPYTPKNESETETIGKYKTGTRQSLYYTNEIVELWLKNFPDAEEWCQKVIPLAEHDEFNKREVFKYSTKPFSFDKKPKGITYKEYKLKLQENFKVWIEIYDELFTIQSNMKLRSFQAFGYKKPKLTEEQEEEAIGKEADEVDNKRIGIYSWNTDNWYNEYGETLSDYIANEKERKRNELLMKAADEIEAGESTEQETTEQNTSFEQTKDDRETQEVLDMVQILKESTGEKSKCFRELCLKNFNEDEMISDYEKQYIEQWIEKNQIELT